MSGGGNTARPATASPKLRHKASAASSDMHISGISAYRSVGAWGLDIGRLTAAGAKRCKSVAYWFLIGGLLQG